MAPKLANIEKFVYPIQPPAPLVGVFTQPMNPKDYPLNLYQ